MSVIQSTVASSPVRTTEADNVATSDRRSYRLASLDVLRGLAIVVMALDHVRDFVMVAAVQDHSAAVEERHETVVHVDLLVAVEER